MGSVLGQDELQQAVAKVDEQQKQEAARTDASQIFIAEVKSSLLYSMDWSQLLSAAPLTLALMGACYVASTASEASVTLTPPAGDRFKHLSWTTLNANLIECSDIGRMAFTKAEVNLGNIALISKTMFNTVGDLIMALGDRNAAKDLKFHMETLKKGSDRCQVAINEVEESFDNWLAYVCELHQASVQQEDDNQKMLAYNQAQLEAKQTSLHSTEEARSMAKAAVDKMGQSLDVTEAAFKKAADHFPSGWDLVGMQVVSSFADTLTSAMGQGMLGSMGNTGVAIQALNIFTKDEHEGQKITATYAPNAGTKMDILDADDPAYAQIGLVLSHVLTLKSLVIGKAGGVDWDAIATSGKNGLDYVAIMLEDAKDSFHPSEKDPSRKLEDVFDICIKIAAEVKSAADELNSLGRSPPDPSSAQVVGWQKRVSDAADTANGLAATAKSLPGAAAGQTPLVNPGLVEDGRGKSGALVTNYLEAATANLNTSLSAYSTAQENYQKATDTQVTVELQLAEILSALALLKANDIKFEEIKKILTKCISTLVQLKEQITNLARFFNALGQFIDHAIEFQVKRFIDYLDTVTSDGPSIAGFSFTDLRRQTIFTYSMMIRSYFSMFRSIGLMYTEVSKEYIFPGLTLCDDLSIEARKNDAQAVMDKKLEDLTTYTNEAQKGVKTKVLARQNEIMSGMEENVKEITNKTLFLPPMEPSQKKAIEAGAKIVTEAVNKQFDKDKPLMLKPFHDTGPLLPPTED